MKILISLSLLLLLLSGGCSKEETKKEVRIKKQNIEKVEEIFIETNTGGGNGIPLEAEGER